MIMIIITLVIVILTIILMIMLMIITIIMLVMILVLVLLMLIQPKYNKDYSNHSSLTYFQFPRRPHKHHGPALPTLLGGGGEGGS